MPENTLTTGTRDPFLTDTLALIFGMVPAALVGDNPYKYADLLFDNILSNFATGKYACENWQHREGALSAEPCLSSDVQDCLGCSELHRDLLILREQVHDG